MIKAFTVGVLGMMLCFFAPSPAASQEDPAAPPEEPAVSVENALSGDEVRKLFEGNTELGEAMKGELETGRNWTAFYSDGRHGSEARSQGRQREEGHLVRRFRGAELLPIRG